MSEEERRSILSEEIVNLMNMVDEIPSDNIPIFERWMNKYTKTLGRIYWRRRFFVLDKGGNLSYFKSDGKGKKPCKPPFSMEGLIFWKSVTKRNAIEIERFSKPFIISGENEKSRKSWIVKLQQVGAIFDSHRMISKVDPEISKCPVKSWTNDQVLDWLSYVPLEYRGFDKEKKDDPFDGFDDPHLKRKDDDASDDDDSDDNEGTCLEGSEYEKCFKDTKGSDLISMTEEDLIKLGIERRDHAREFSAYISRMRMKNGICSIRYHYVLRKLTSLLSNPVALRRSYLTFEKIDPKSFLPRSLLMKMMKKHQNKGSPPNADAEEVEGEDEGDLPPLNLIQNLKEECNVEIKEILKTLEVKLILTELEDMNLCPSIFDLLSPAMSVNQRRENTGKTRVGKIRVACVIGGWYFEWNPSSLCIPRRIKKTKSGNSDFFSSIPCLSYTCHEHVRKGLIEENVANEVCRWNTSKTYTTQKSNILEEQNIQWKSNIEGNPVDFVQSLFFETYLSGIRLKGCVRSFLNSMINDDNSINEEQKRKRRKGVLTFQPGGSFRKFFGLKKHKTVSFRTHRQLDEFVCDLEPYEKDQFVRLTFRSPSSTTTEEEEEEEDSNTESTVFNPLELIRESEEFREEYFLLASFDRIFWYRHFNQKDDDRFLPLHLEKSEEEQTENELATGCPFFHPDDPRSDAKVITREISKQHKKKWEKKSDSDSK